MQVFTKLWRSFSRLATMLNRLADVGEAVADATEQRLLGVKAAGKPAREREPVRVAVGVLPPPDAASEAVEPAKGRRRIKASANGHAK